MTRNYFNIEIKPFRKLLVKSLTNVWSNFKRYFKAYEYLNFVQTCEVFAKPIREQNFKILTALQNGKNAPSNSSSRILIMTQQILTKKKGFETKLIN